MTLLVEALFPNSNFKGVCQLQKHCGKGQRRSHTLLQLISSDVVTRACTCTSLERKHFNLTNNKLTYSVIKKHLNYSNINFTHCQLCKIGDGLQMGLAHFKKRNSA